MSGHVIRSIASVLAAADPALPVSDPRVVDASATPGDVVVSAVVRVLRVKVATGTSENLVTHPAVTTASVLLSNQEGNPTLTPEATRRWNVRPVNGGIVFGISGGAVADDGPIDILIGAL